MNRHRNILLIANYPSDVGYAWWLMENFWRELAEYAARSGRRAIMAFPKVAALSEIIRAAPLEVIEFDYAAARTGNGRAMREIVRRFEIGGIYLTDAPIFDWYYLHLRLLGVRLILDHDHTPGERPPVRGWRRMAKKALHGCRLWSCDYYLAVSHFVLDRLRETAAVPSSRCLVVENGVEPITCPDHGARALLDEFSIPREAVVVVSASRVAPHKRVDFMVDCADAIINGEGRDDVYFLHLGDGPDMARLRRRIADTGLAKRFVLAGQRRDVRALVCACDIGFHASTAEVGYSLSIIEFMSAGLATLVPDARSVKLATEHGRTGMLFRWDSVEDASRALLRLIDDVSYRAALGAAARLRVQEHYNIGRCNRDFRKAMTRIFRDDDVAVSKT
jgi:glycosyltransferase involved in cell wall biosynthesis